jgi:hypothetical protein
MGLFGVPSVFGRRIKGICSNVTKTARHVYNIYCKELHIYHSLELALYLKKTVTAITVVCLLQVRNESFKGKEHIADNLVKLQQKSGDYDNTLIQTAAAEKEVM